MPVADDSLDAEVSASDTRELQQDKDKGAKSKGLSKVKDLSHVPCKFFKVGSCTAGPSCPFSHQMHEPGQQKDVCTWFVKGNCKFGHKCALAHVLPGQSMSMDRRNKKAAQLAAGGGQANGQKDREGSAKGDKGKKPTSNPVAAPRGTSGQARSLLSSGSTAPTRVLPAGSRPPLSISKAVPAPAAPAPSLQDTDFASFDFMKVDETQSGSKPPSTPATPTLALDASPDHERSNTLDNTDPSIKAPFLPISTPSQPLRFTGHHGSTPSVDFGPVGSPPKSSPSSHTRIDGFSPGVSPREQSQHSHAPISSSPFSAPGGQSLFMPYDQGTSPDTSKMRSGLAVSLGATRTLIMGSLPVPTQRSVSGPRIPGTDSGALEDEDMEEFIPSSLTDLLTPGEKSRRLSRTSSTNPASVVTNNTTSRPSVQNHHHRYSRSVPAPSLLSDIKAIWADPVGADFPVRRQPGPGTSAASGQGVGLGRPSSYTSNSGFLSGLGEDGPSPSLLSPTNASAAFLPTLHQHYASRPSRDSLHTVSQYSTQNVSLAHSSTTSNGAPASSLYLPSHPSNAVNSSSSDYTMDQTQLVGRPIPSSGVSFFPSDLPLSPSARALQAHAPGQSLPQGLAAGYSRIHVQPPPPNVPSPIMPGTAYSPGMIAGQPQAHIVGSPDWSTVSSSENTTLTSDVPITSRVSVTNDHTGESGVGGLTSMFSRLSYSAAAARSPPPTNTSHPVPVAGIPNGTIPMSMSRRPSGRGWSSHPLSSPLSGPVLTNDDDLFSMDEEK